MFGELPSETLRNGNLRRLAAPTGS